MTEESTASAPVMKLTKKTPSKKATAEIAEPSAGVAKVVGEKADTSGAAPAYSGADSIQVIAQEAQALKEEKAFKLVPDLLDNIDHDFMRLGAVLARIQSEGWYMNKGFETFRAYVEGETDVGYRKSMYLIGIYNSLVTSGVSWEQVSCLGWTKLVELAPHLTQENVEEWVLRCNGLTVLQIKELIKEATSSTSEDTAPTLAGAPKTVTMTFKLHEDQKATIREALDKCKHETGTDVDTVALEHICLDFLGGSAIKAAPSLKDLMSKCTAEDVLNLFGEVFPDVTLQAELP